MLAANPIATGNGKLPEEVNLSIASLLLVLTYFAQSPAFSGVNVGFACCATAISA